MPPETEPSPHDVKRLEHIVKSAQDAIEIVGNLTGRDLLNDMIRARALVNCFTEIGEAAARLSDPARALVGELPWRQIIGMRNIIVHVYWGIDMDELVKTTRDDLPALKSAAQKAIDRLAQ